MDIAAARAASSDFQSEALQERIQNDLLDNQRSASNIAEWRSYLSDACVNAMINMGWNDLTQPRTA